jgi:hypothetical protein
MAYDFVRASSQYLTASNAVASFPFTFACWINLKTTNVSQGIISVRNTSGNENLLMSFNGTTSPVRLPQLILINSANSFGGNVSSFNAAVSANTWYHVACSAEAVAGGLKTYRDGAAGTTGAVGFTGTVNTTIIGAINTNSEHANALIAEVGIWNAALTAAEIASLAKGMTCDKARPQNLVFYAPLVRDLIDAKGGLTITNNNTATVANHPRVYA